MCLSRLIWLSDYISLSRKIMLRICQIMAILSSSSIHRFKLDALLGRFHYNYQYRLNKFEWTDSITAQKTLTLPHHTNVMNNTMWASQMIRLFLLQFLNSETWIMWMRRYSTFWMASIAGMQSWSPTWMYSRASWIMTNISEYAHIIHDAYQLLLWCLL